MSHKLWFVWCDSRVKVCLIGRADFVLWIFNGCKHFTACKKRICLRACASLLYKQVRVRVRFIRVQVHVLVVMSCSVCINITTDSPQEVFPPHATPLFTFPPSLSLCDTSDTSSGAEEALMLTTHKRRHGKDANSNLQTDTAWESCFLLLN